MEKRLLTILRCPVTNKGLALASRDKLGRVNHAIKAGGLANRDGRELADPLSEALVTGTETQATATQPQSLPA